jgi:hypothetical protein
MTTRIDLTLEQLDALNTWVKAESAFQKRREARKAARKFLDSTPLQDEGVRAAYSAANAAYCDLVDATPGLRFARLPDGRVSLDIEPTA